MLSLLDEKSYSITSINNPTNYLLFAPSDSSRGRHSKHFPSQIPGYKMDGSGRLREIRELLHARAF